MNNKGWGLTAMLGFCCFLGICLLTSYYYYNKVNSYSNNNSKMELENGYKMTNDYSSITPSNISYHYSTSNYEKMENDLVEHTKRYVNSNNLHIDGNKLIITNKKLGYTMYDSHDNYCSGYCIYQNNVYTPYIDCGSYKTNNYYQSLN